MVKIKRIVRVATRVCTTMTSKRFPVTKKSPLSHVVAIMLILSDLSSPFSIAASNSLPSVVKRSPLLVRRRSASEGGGASTMDGDGVDVSAYCRTMCQWGRGGNLCRCNAAYFAGRKRSSAPGDDEVSAADNMVRYSTIVRGRR